jgi:hypothetical protein
MPPPRPSSRYALRAGGLPARAPPLQQLLPQPQQQLLPQPQLQLLALLPPR